MNELATTALYLFSSLLQADATLLGFGAIFVIYKMESMETRFRLARELCQTRHADMSQYATSLIMARNDAERIEVLRGLKSSIVFTELELLVTIPARLSQIRKSIKLPLILSGVHMSTCAILLWEVPRWDFKFAWPWWSAYSILGWFVLCAFFAARVAWNLVTKYDALTLKEVKPRVHEAIFADQPQQGNQP